MIKKRTNYILYIDISISIFMLLVLVYSILPNSFTIFPIEVRNFVGIQNFRYVLDAIHYLLIGLTVIFISQSIIYYIGFISDRIKYSLVIDLFFYKWLCLTIINIIPLFFNHSPPPIFLIIHLIVLVLFYYEKMNFFDNNG